MIDTDVALALPYSWWTNGVGYLTTFQCFQYSAQLIIPHNDAVDNSAAVM